ncbi:hypothetical protein BKA57DRAFT_540220 [Linnemannia elongata]|nr:hypothetical protein BKA57DRAFT_540220 [Linnemannia elongata]
MVQPPPAAHATSTTAGKPPSGVPSTEPWYQAHPILGQNYPSPIGGHAPPAGGYSPAAGGYAQPTGGYTPSAGGYAPPAGGYSPPAGGYAAPAGGYTPPAGEYAPPAGGYAPPMGGYMPPAGGYAPQTGYAPPVEGYAPPGGGQGPPSVRQNGRVSYIDDVMDNGFGGRGGGRIPIAMICFIFGLCTWFGFLLAKEWFVKAVKYGREESQASLSEVLRLIEQDEEAAKATEKKKNKSTCSRLKFYTITITTSTFTLNTFTLANHHPVKNPYKTMEDDNLQVQPMRSVTKSSVDSATLSPPAPTIYIDCHQDPTTKKPIILWDDICLAFADALHVRNQARVLPFLKGDGFVLLKPLRIAAVPNVVLDVIVEDPLVRLETVVQQTSIADPHQNLTMMDGPQEDSTPIHAHTNDPAAAPPPYTLRFIPSTRQGDGNIPTGSRPNYNGNPANSNTQWHSLQDHSTVCSAEDITAVILKATSGDNTSQVKLGNIYRIGDGIERDYDAAHYWYLEAAKQGDASAQFNLGDLFRLGLGVEYSLGVTRDYSVAMERYRKAAHQGYALAQCSIGDLYAFGLGVSQDHIKAMGWYLRAADQDLPMAHFRLGVMYYNGNGVSKDTAVGLEWLYKAIRPKDTDVWAQYAMGHMYSWGIGVPQDDDLSFAWYHRAACQGSPNAQYQLGTMYQSGTGVLQDNSKALEWLTKAAEHNLPSAQYQVGSFFLVGRGVLKDYVKAKEWYSKAAGLGYELARTGLLEVQQLIEDERVKEKKRKTISRLKFW